MSLLRLPKQCLAPMEYGQNCGQLTPKWYFDTQEKVCYSFEYSGCGSEFSNRFETKDECNSLCVDNFLITNQNSTSAIMSTQAKIYEAFIGT